MGFGKSFLNWCSGTYLWQKQLGKQFRTTVGNGLEGGSDSWLSPPEHPKSLKLEKRKLKLSAGAFQNSIILACDTIVFFNGKILGKPETASHAKSMLTQLNGKLHTVFSGYSILDSDSGNEITDFVCTKVKFHVMPPDLLEWYVSTGESLGKAGAYSKQAAIYRFEC